MRNGTTATMSGDRATQNIVSPPSAELSSPVTSCFVGSQEQDVAIVAAQRAIWAAFSKVKVSL
jgi:hypothetical protein